jgi:transposase
MLSHGLELRRRIVDAYQNREGSIRALAARFGVSRSTVQRFLGRWREAGTVAPKPHGGGHPRTLDARGGRMLAELLRDQPGLPDHEYARRLTERLGRSVSRQAVNQARKRMAVAREGDVRRAIARGRPST